IHPPMLYLGYVGMTIPFGFAAAALLRGRLGQSFLRPLRASLLLPWVFLTIAIMLGGWWAYEVLGWGGYWAWDPVENASLLPWLTATAALHSAIVMERRGVLKGWTVTLIQASFLLTILGTFMTRSGVFNSVHSFTQSAIGPTILAFLAAVLIFSIALLAFRIDSLEAEGSIDSAASKEGAFRFDGGWTLATLFVGGYAAHVTLAQMWQPLVQRLRRGDSFSNALVNGQLRRGRRRFGSYIVHAGAVIVLISIAVSSTMRTSH